jgi:hypothetical protein
MSRWLLNNKLIVFFSTSHPDVHHLVVIKILVSLQLLVTILKNSTKKKETLNKNLKRKVLIKYSKSGIEGKKGRGSDGKTG